MAFNGDQRCRTGDRQGIIPRISVQWLTTVFGGSRSSALLSRALALQSSGRGTARVGVNLLNISTSCGACNMAILCSTVIGAAAFGLADSMVHRERRIRHRSM